MTEKKYGTGVIVNHTHPTKTEPIIHVHNTTPFENYEQAADELKRKIMHPGEIVVVYYKNPAADDGISSIIATGPLQSGGYNEIFKNAEQIDDLAKYLEEAIGTQDTDIKAVMTELRAEIIATTQTMVDQARTDAQNTVTEGLAQIEIRVNDEINDFKQETDAKVDASIMDMQNRLQTATDEMSAEIQRVETKEEQHIDSSYRELSERISAISGDIDGEVFRHIEKLDSSVNSLEGRVEENSSEITYIKGDVSDFKQTVFDASTEIAEKYDGAIQQIMERLDEQDRLQTWRELEDSEWNPYEDADPSDDNLPFNAFWRPLSN